jgi:hypothetical protein
MPLFAWSATGGLSILVATTVAYFLLAAITAILIVAALFLIGLDRLSGGVAIARDGLRRGSRAPAWRQPDVDGVMRGLPDGRWKLLAFTDHSLRSFPGVAEALNALHQCEANLDVIVASRAPRSLTKVTFRALGLTVPTVIVDSDFYHRYRVRVKPFATVIDPAGMVRSAGLIGTRDEVLTVWRVGRLMPLEADRGPRGWRSVPQP